MWHMCCAGITMCSQAKHTSLCYNIKYADQIPTHSLILPQCPLTYRKVPPVPCCSIHSYNGILFTLEFSDWMMTEVLLFSTADSTYCVICSCLDYIIFFYYYFDYTK